MTALRIGLTGPIGCGKSTVAGWLAERGAVVIDADQVARDVVERGSPGFEEVVRAFGPTVVGPDGALDRPALGRIVFAEPEALARLEAIVHPLVRPRIMADLAAADASGADLAVLEAIKLVDAGYPDLLDEVWFVTCPPEAQRTRLEGRGLGRATAEQRMAAQDDLLDRAAAAATRTIDTSGTIAEARRRVDAALDDATEAGRRARASRPRSGA